MSRRKNKQLKRQNPAKTPAIPEPKAVIAHSTTAFSGPIPPPDLLMKYDLLLPGAAERIIAMAEKESAHRKEMERIALNADIKIENRDYDEARWGQILGFLFGLFTVYFGAITAMSGAEWAGGFIGTGGLASIVIAFISGRKREKQK